MCQCVSLLGLPYKVPQTSWLQQQKFTSHSSGGWELQDQGADQGGFTLSPLLSACRQLPLLCSQMVGEQRECAGISSYKDSNMYYGIRAPPYDLTES